jgi:hypothetical protein
VPRTGISGQFASPARSWSGEAVKICLISAGSLTKMTRPTLAKRTVNTSP